MKYLCLAYYNEKAFDGLPSREMDDIVRECGPYDEAFRATDRLFAVGSLAEHEAVTLRPRKGEVSVSDGHHVAGSDQVGAFFIIEADSRDEAVRIASRHPAARIGERVGWAIEVRPIASFEQPGA